MRHDEDGYSGTSQRGHSNKGTVYYIPLQMGQTKSPNFIPPINIMQLEPLKEDNLYIGDNSLEIIMVRCSKVSLYYILAGSFTSM